MVSYVKEAKLSRGLATHLRRVRLFDGAALAPSHTYRRLPDGETEVLVRLGDGDETATVIGTRTIALAKRATRRADTLVLRFHAGGFHRFAGCSMAELTDQVVALGDIWDRPSCDALMGLGSAANAPERVVELLERLLGRAGPEPPSALATRRAIEALRRAVYLPGVRQLAAVLGASERQLRRAFSEVIGLSPKQYLRVLRFRRVLDETRRTAAPSWPDLAVRAGYYDQAHLIAEFRAMTGSTPAAWIASSSTAS